MTSPDDVKMNNLTEFAYSKFCAHYSKKNWVSNWPLWSDLSDRDKSFWREFVLGIRSEFNNRPKPDVKVDKAN